MKMKSFFLTLVCLLAATAIGMAAASLSQTAANINADAQKEGGPAKVLQSISKSTGVPVATLEKEKAKTGLTYGDLFAAHSIAKASGKSFDEIAAMKKKGQTWDQIAEANGVSQGGKKTAQKANAQPAAAKPTPSATPKKTLQQIQRERYQ
jgi:hypothetical protein